jgi:hypothetical protein
MIAIDSCGLVGRLHFCIWLVVDYAGCLVEIVFVQNSKTYNGQTVFKQPKQQATTTTTQQQGTQHLTAASACTTKVNQYSTGSNK